MAWYIQLSLYATTRGGENNYISAGTSTCQDTDANGDKTMKFL